MNDRVRLVGLQETYTPVAITLLLTSVIRVSRPHPKLYNLNNMKARSALPLFTHKKGRKKKFVQTKMKEQTCSNETKGMELVRLLQKRPPDLFN